MTEELIDHRKIGIDQELFFFSEHSPGSCFWLPNGTIIFNKLQQFIRDEYYKRGFQEVKSPVIAKDSLWKISGSWDVYKDNMFCFKCDDNEGGVEYAMSPMNCSKHCLMYNFRNRSYKELPLRFADFGALHRNELSGALTGLTRVRNFHQDDSHIYCTRFQIKSEIKNCLNFLTDVYSKFGFNFEVALSTRPEKYIGELELWDESEKQLVEILTESGFQWTLNKGDGAFYGNKIDIRLTDSLNRKHQCATIQLDFNIPERFKLEYIDENGQSQRPVMIHRAIYGSFERFVAILCEHYNGKFPLWLNPKQVVIVPITNKINDYAHEIKQKLMEYKYYIDVDDSDLVLGKKIENAKFKHYNYILIVGPKDLQEQTITVQYRDNNTRKVVKIEELVTELALNVKEFK